MPTNKQRLSAVAATAAIVFGGGWLASLVPVATATEHAVSYENAPETANSVTAPVAASGAHAPPTVTNPDAAEPVGKTMPVKITGVRNGSGKIYVALFDDASAFNGYDYEQAVDFREFPARSGTLTVHFTGIEGDAYAISLFHDENGNQNFDIIDGYPAEGYGTSRATSPNDELKFHQASITPGPISIAVHYLN